MISKVRFDTHDVAIQELVLRANNTQRSLATMGLAGGIEHRITRKGGEWFDGPAI